MEKEIAAKLYYLENIRQDPILGILQIIDQLHGSDIKAVINYYQEMKAGKIELAQVTSALALSETEKTKMVSFLKLNFSSEIVVIFETEEKILDGLQIKVGKNIVKLS